MLLGEDEWPLPNSSVATRNSPSSVERMPGPDQPFIGVEVRHVALEGRDRALSLVFKWP